MSINAKIALKKLQFHSLSINMLWLTKKSSHIFRNENENQNCLNLEGAYFRGRGWGLQSGFYGNILLTLNAIIAYIRLIKCFYGNLNVFYDTCQGLKCTVFLYNLSSYLVYINRYIEDLSETK